MFQMNKALSFFLDFLAVEDGTIGCPETSVMNNHYNLRNIPKDLRSNLDW